MCFFVYVVVVVETTYIRAAENAGVALQITLVELAAVPGIGEVQLSLCHVLWGAGVVVVGVDGYLGGHHHGALEGRDAEVQFSLFQFKVESMRSEKPIYAPSRLSGVSPPTLKHVC